MVATNNHFKIKAFHISKETRSKRARNEGGEPHRWIFWCSMFHLRWLKVGWGWNLNSSHRIKFWIVIKRANCSQLNTSKTNGLKKKKYVLGQFSYFQFLNIQTDTFIESMYKFTRSSITPFVHIHFSPYLYTHPFNLLYFTLLPVWTVTKIL